MSKILKISIKILNTIIITITVLLAILILGSKLLGYQMFTVLSGSMEPEYPVGSLIIVKDIEPSELEVGDVITFKLGSSTTATHRIIEILHDDNQNSLEFRTKGDANDIEDSDPVEESRIIGKPVLTIPEAGARASKLQSPEGKKKTIAVFAALILFVFVSDFFVGDKKEKKSDTTEN